LLSGHIPQQVEKSSIVKTLTNKVIVNEKLLKELNMGSAQEAVGKTLLVGRGYRNFRCGGRL